MKVIVLVILSLLVSCGPSGTSVQYNDSILNYRGGEIIRISYVGYECSKVRVRMYDTQTKRYTVKIIYVYDAGNYLEGQIIK